MPRKPKLPPGAPAWAVGYSARGEDGVPEWICQHGVGHGGVHTCDEEHCCTTDEEHARAMREYNARCAEEKAQEKARRTMRAKEYPLLERCLEDGVRLGWQRAHKHTDKPTPEAIQEAIVQAQTNEVCDWFDFPETGTDE